MPLVTENGVRYWNRPTSPPARPISMPASVAIGMAIVRAWATPGMERVRLPDGETIWTTKEPRP